jgi:hypothetical protein
MVPLRKASPGRAATFAPEDGARLVVHGLPPRSANRAGLLPALPDGSRPTPKRPRASPAMGIRATSSCCRSGARRRGSCPTPATRASSPARARSSRSRTSHQDLRRASGSTSRNRASSQVGSAWSRTAHRATAAEARSTTSVTRCSRSDEEAEPLAGRSQGRRGRCGRPRRARRRCSLLPEQEEASCRRCSSARSERCSERLGPTSGLSTELSVPDCRMEERRTEWRARTDDVSS